MLSRSFGLSLLLGSALVLRVLPASAAQFVLLDTTYTQTIDCPNSHCAVKVAPGTPSNWKSPVDYSTGTVYLRHEVLTKPSDLETFAELAILGRGNGYGYTAVNWPNYKTTGVYEWSAPFSAFRHSDTFDFANGPSRGLNLVLSTMIFGERKRVNSTPDPSKFVPSKIKVTIVVVSKGSVFMKPPGWGNITNPPQGDGGAALGPDGGRQGDDASAPADGPDAQFPTITDGGTSGGEDVVASKQDSAAKRDLAAQPPAPKEDAAPAQEPEPVAPLPGRASTGGCQMAVEPRGGSGLPGVLAGFMALTVIGVRRGFRSNESTTKRS
jgi:hypothetical protein